MVGSMSPTPTLYPYKSVQTTVHRKIGVHEESQCLRFQNGPHEQHSLFPWAYQCLQWTGSSIPFIINKSIEPMLRLCEGSSLYGPEFELQFNKLIAKIIESDLHVTGLQSGWVCTWRHFSSCILLVLTDDNSKCSKWLCFCFYES